MPESRRNIVRVLNKFQFDSKPGRGDHVKFFRKAIVSGRERRIMTIVDSDNEIPIGTFQAILKQVFLLYSNYPNALKCPYSIEDYEKDLAKRTTS